MIDCSGQRRSLIDILTSSTSRTDLTHTRTQKIGIQSNLPMQSPLLSIHLY